MRLGLLVCAFALLAPGVVRAQTGTLTVDLVSVEDPDGIVRERLGQDVELGVNAFDCSDPANTVLTFRASASPTMNSFDLWVSQNNNCQATTTRVGPTQTCFDIGRQITTLEANMTFSVTLAELQTPSLDPCAAITSNAGGNFYLHVFDSSSDNTTGELTGPFAVATIPVDVVPPAAPTLTSGDSSGATAVPVTWELPTADADFQRYRYEIFGVAGCDGAAPVGDGGTATDGGTGDSIQIGDASGGATETTVNPSEFGLAEGEGMSVTVRAIDPAGNTGPFSDAVCITLQPTAGFCGVFGAMGGDCGGRCSVAAPGARGGSTAALAGGVLALGLAFARRRARSGRKERA